MKKNGKDLGKIAVVNLERLIASCQEQGRFLPCHSSGKALHLGEICRILGVVRTTVNTNPTFRKLLKDYAARNNLQYSLKGKIAPEEDIKAQEDPSLMVPIGKLHDALKRLSNCEKRISELKAENLLLRSQAYQHQEVMNLIALGGRFLPPNDCEQE